MDDSKSQAKEFELCFREKRSHCACVRRERCVAHGKV